MDAVIDNLPYMLEGLKTTLIAAIGIVFSFLLGTLLALCRLSTRPWVRWPAIAYIEGVRSVPLILFIFFIYFMLAALGYDVSAFWAATVAIVVFISTYVAEIIRGGILSVPAGQLEAARASGLSYRAAMRFVVLPQATRVMVPALVSESVIVVKETSLAMVIGVPEFFNRVLITNARVLTEPFALLGFAAAVYFVICYSLSILSRRLELRANV